MKKIIALALALIMVLSLSAVAFAADTATPDVNYEDTFTIPTTPTEEITNWVADVPTLVHPGDFLEISDKEWAERNTSADPEVEGTLYGWRITDVDFTTGELCGASWIEDVEITKEKDAIRIEIKEAYTLAEDENKVAEGIIYLEDNLDNEYELTVSIEINNEIAVVYGEKKASEAYELEADEYGHNVVTVMDEDGGYVSFTCEQLTGVVKMNDDEATQLSVENDIDEDTLDEIETYLGEDFVDDSIIEYYQFETRAFKNEVAFTYDAYAEDPHYFYLWDGETLTALDAQYDDDEDVEAYVWTGIADGVIVIADEEIADLAVADEEEDKTTENPDTGANDVVGVAAALAVVSLVAAGAVSLKKH